jgi:hypothetical protein
MSPWDVVGLQRAYGRKPDLSVVGAGNKCVDLENPAVPAMPSGPTRLQAYACLGNANQQWIRSSMGTLVAWQYGSGYGTMDVQWGNSADGTPLWNWTYNGSSAQVWRWSGVEIVGMGDLCLDVPGASFYAGAPVQLYPCNGSSAQLWDLEPPNAAGRIRSNAHPELCLSATGTSALTLQTCLADASQAWTLYHGRIQVPRSGVSADCIDVAGANPASGTRVGRYGCRPDSDDLRYAQLWYARGAIKGLAGKCVDAGLGRVDYGTAIQLWSCNGGANQTWDLHF